MFLGLPLGDSRISHWLEPVFIESEEYLNLHHADYDLFGIDGFLILMSVGLATIGLVAGIALFGAFRRNGRIDTVRRITNANGVTRFLYRASLNKWWFDELNDLLFIRIGGRVAAFLWWFDELNDLLFIRIGGRVAAFLWWFDRTIVDGAVNGVGLVTRDAGGGLRRIQTGRVQNYALGIAIGLLVMVGSFLVIVGQPR
jgi:NADH:ubiquinone oxidoreductase subunit 5 (subunit L)/multisubunit Na+/H+ antiporter MnhA subunit